jgi:hypothetical protein
VLSGTRRSWFAVDYGSYGAYTIIGMMVCLNNAEKGIHIQRVFACNWPPRLWYIGIFFVVNVIDALKKIALFIGSS